ncbi:MAG TPA: lysylphosphatidylglycerol synthase domain-containing protein [Gemmataceae bacterium]|jgi:hypothetical protein|nr:lysylphosphatidylglycerol synthase domain-containing protein [Gemmataceae bacterium]
MRAWLAKWWPVLKLVLAGAIVAAVGWQFARDLRRPELWERSFHAGWLALSGLLYLVGMGFWMAFWYRLLRLTGQQPSVPAAVRAYYLGLMGKYLPGKAWALVLRATLSRGRGVRLGVAGFTALYEVLTTMAGGVLLAAVLFAWLLPDVGAAGHGAILRRLLRKDVAEDVAPDRTGLVLLSLGLFAALGTPIIPAVFSHIVRHLSSFNRVMAGERGAGAFPPLPHLGVRCLIEGLVLTPCGWLVWGGSLWAVVQAMADRPQAWQWDVWGRYTAALALAYVAGFVIVIVPSGIGVREFFLTLFLAPELGRALGLAPADARPVAVLAVLLLRVAWTAAEIVMSAVVYWLPGPRPETEGGS